MSDLHRIESAVRGFVLETFWSDLDSGSLTDTTDLVEAGTLDSMNVLRLVDFIEEAYDLMLEPEDLFRLTSIANIAEVVREKA